MYLSLRTFLSLKGRSCFLAVATLHVNLLGIFLFRLWSPCSSVGRVFDLWLVNVPGSKPGLECPYRTISFLLNVSSLSFIWDIKLRPKSIAYLCQLIRWNIFRFCMYTYKYLLTDRSLLSFYHLDINWLWKVVFKIRNRISVHYW